MLTGFFTHKDADYPLRQTLWRLSGESYQSAEGLNREIQFTALIDRCKTYFDDNKDKLNRGVTAGNLNRLLTLLILRLERNTARGQTLTDETKTFVAQLADEVEQAHMANSLTKMLAKTLIILISDSQDTQAIYHEFKEQYANQCYPDSEMTIALCAITARHLKLDDQFDRFIHDFNLTTYIARIISGEITNDPVLITLILNTLVQDSHEHSSVFAQHIRQLNANMAQTPTQQATILGLCPYVTDDEADELLREMLFGDNANSDDGDDNTIDKASINESLAKRLWLNIMPEKRLTLLNDLEYANADKLLLLRVLNTLLPRDYFVSALCTLTNETFLSDIVSSKSSADNGDLQSLKDLLCNLLTWGQQAGLSHRFMIERLETLFKYFESEGELSNSLLDLLDNDFDLSGDDGLYSSLYDSDESSTDNLSECTIKLFEVVQRLSGDQEWMTSFFDTIAAYFEQQQHHLPAMELLAFLHNLHTLTQCAHSPLEVSRQGKKLSTRIGHYRGIPEATWQWMTSELPTQYPSIVGRRVNKTNIAGKGVALKACDTTEKLVDYFAGELRPPKGQAFQIKLSSQKSMHRCNNFLQQLTLMYCFMKDELPFDANTLFTCLVPMLRKGRFSQTPEIIYLFDLLYDDLSDLNKKFVIEACTNLASYSPGNIKSSAKAILKDTRLVDQFETTGRFSLESVIRRRTLRPKVSLAEVTPNKLSDSDDSPHSSQPK